MLSPVSSLHCVLVAFEHDEHVEAADERAPPLRTEDVREQRATFVDV